MEIRILEERTNPLMKRHELRFEVAHATAATPTRDSVRSELAKAIHAAKDRVVIERMKPRFGTAVTRGEANVYESADAAKSITREHILVRNGLKEKVAKDAAAPAPPAPAESPKPEPSKTEGPAASAAPEPTPPPAAKAAHPAPASRPKDAGGESAAAPEAPKKPRAHPKKE
jgi:small subunit ribosomal protein S24e